MTRLLLPLLASSLLAACASVDDGRIPSLAPRAAETRGFEEPAPPPPAAARPDPALDAKIAAVGARIGTNDADFRDRSAKAGATVAAAAGSPAGSEAWLNAQVALGTLDVVRAAMSEAVTSLEELAADRGIAGEPPYPPLEQALADARTRQEKAAGEIETLGARLRR